MSCRLYYDATKYALEDLILSFQCSLILLLLYYCCYYYYLPKSGFEPFGFFCLLQLKLILYKIQYDSNLKARDKKEKNNERGNE